MKKFSHFIHIALAATSLLMAFSCKNPVEEENNSTEVELEGISDAVVFDAQNPQEVTFTINSNKPWSITTKGDWITASQYDGEAGKAQTIKVSANVNSETAAREGSITVSAAEFSQTIKLSQMGSDPILFIDGINDDNTVNFTSGGGLTSLVITGNVPWTLVCDGIGDWCTITPTEGPSGEGTPVNVSATVNKGEARDFTVYLRYGDITMPLKIIQDEVSNYLAAEKNIAELSGFGGSTSIIVNSNVPWTATASEPWLTVSPDSGTGDGVELTFSAGESNGDRTASVTLKGEGVPDVLITVNQIEVKLPDDPTLPRSVVSWNLNRGTVTAEDFAKQNPGWAINPDKETFNTSGVIIAEDNLNTGTWYCAHRDYAGDYFRTNFSTGLALAGPWVDDGFKFTWNGANAAAGRTLAFYCGMRDSTPNVIGYWTVRISLDGEKTWIEADKINWYGSDMAEKDHYVSPTDVVAKFKLRQELKDTDVVVFLQATLAPDGRALSRQLTVRTADKAKDTTIRFCETVNSFNGQIYNGPTIVLEN